jgi:hypothetical protein
VLNEILKCWAVAKDSFCSISLNLVGFCQYQNILNV